MRDKLLHHLFQWVLIVHNHLSKPGIFSITEQETSHNTWAQKFAALHEMLLLYVLPWTVCHFVGIVVEADNRFALLNSRKQHHQGSVRHHQIQVVLCEVKIYSLHCGKKTLCYTAAMSLNKKILIAINSTHNVKENLTNVNSVQKFTNVVLEEQESTNITGLINVYNVFFFT